MGNRAVTPRTGRATASVDGTVLASTTAWVETEGNVYFPPASVRREFFSGTDHSTYCPWKGNASYYDIEVNGELHGPDHGYVWLTRWLLRIQAG
jgi:uncharacterized protein (DUF427 family)